jgi:hypothetical protein
MMVLDLSGSMSSGRHRPTLLRFQSSRCSGPDYARSMAAYAASLDVTVITISLGDDADLDLMQDIADATGGEHFDATGSGESVLTERLTEAFRQVAASIKRTQLVQ